MKGLRSGLSFGVMCLCSAVFAGGHQAKAKPAFRFAGAEYFRRFAEGNLTEFTPTGQTDLQKWTEMVTVNAYPDVKSGEALAKAANSVLETYQKAGGRVVRTDSVPRTSKKPAEHLIVVLFVRPDFSETAFARFVMDRGAGASVVYSHRVYGKKSGDAMGAWLKANGEKREKELMAMAVPQH